MSPEAFREENPEAYEERYAVLELLRMHRESSGHPVVEAHLSMLIKAISKSYHRFLFSSKPVDYPEEAMEYGRKLAEEIAAQHAADQGIEKYEIHVAGPVGAAADHSYSVRQPSMTGAELRKLFNLEPEQRLWYTGCDLSAVEVTDKTVVSTKQHPRFEVHLTSLPRQAKV